MSIVRQRHDINERNIIMLEGRKTWDLEKEANLIFIDTLVTAIGQKNMNCHVPHTVTQWLYDSKNGA